VTMANDAFNLAARGWRDTGVRTLDPGQSLSCWTTIALEA
jgi:galactose mutarotase-like enzyme